MKNNSSRINTTQENGKFILTINAFNEEDKQKFFSVWLGAFTLCGLAILSQLFTSDNSEMKLMIFVFGVFWGYFEYKMVRTWKWRRNGQEAIEIDDENIYIGRRYNQRGILKAYPLKEVQLPRKFVNESNDFVKSMNESYWMISNEQLCLTYRGKLIMFGLRLTDKEMGRVLKLVQQEITKRLKD
jgi:hypothetical protein